MQSTEVIRNNDDHGSKPVSWGAIFAGAVVSVALWALLFSLGMALGLSSVNPNDPIKGEAIFTGIWAILTPLVALFVGGAVAAWLAGSFDKLTGALHGSVVWGITLLLGAFALTSFLGAIGGAATSSIGGLASAASGAAKGTSPGDVSGALGVNSSELLAPINQKLAEQGKPQVTAPQLENAVKSAIGSSLRQGKVDSELLTTSLARETNLSREDVRDLAGTLSAKAGQASEQIQETAVSAASTTGKVMWGVFFALMLGLVSAVLGAVAGTGGYAKRHQTVVHNVRHVTP